MHLGVEGCVAFARRRFAVVACRRIVQRIKKPVYSLSSLWRTLRNGGFSAPSTRQSLASATILSCRNWSCRPVGSKGITQQQESLILLFVCATTRAVNLQLVQTMSTEDVILGYRRFVARHGTPALIRSDNGPAFVAAAKMIPVDWRFNLPLSPWHGGFYERLVAVVKAPLRRVLGKSLLALDELSTILLEIEHVVNDRPITYVAGVDEPPPLTPNMLAGSQTQWFTLAPFAYKGRWRNFHVLGALSSELNFKTFFQLFGALFLLCS